MDANRKYVRFGMTLHASQDETLQLPVIHWKDDVYCSQAEMDLFEGTLLLWGDPFRASRQENGEFRLEEIIAPSPMRHFQTPLGNYVLNGDIRTPEARQEAYQGLGRMFDDMYGTPELRQFLKTRGGTFHYWDFLIVAEFFIHIHQNFVDELMRELPSLCPGLRAESLTEIFSGENTQI